MISSRATKKRIIQYGADICGVAPVARFEDAPKGFHPCDIYPDCRSVVVFASRFPLSTLWARTNAPYTLVRNRMVDKLDEISFHVSSELESEGVVSVPIPSAEPYEYWDARRNHGRGVLSLKHAGVLAGLGVLGKNTLLMNEMLGNMMWLGAVLVSTDLDPDPIASYEGCDPECKLCIDSCPQHALDGTTIDQKLCRERSISYNYGGGWVLSCNICRKVCPYREDLLRIRREKESVEP
jgi:epoxyqueuosine reductase